MYSVLAALFLVIAAAAPGRALEKKGYMPYDTAVNESTGLYPVSDKDIYFMVSVQNTYEQRKGSQVHAGYKIYITPYICISGIPQAQLGVYKTSKKETSSYSNWKEIGGVGCGSTTLITWSERRDRLGSPYPGWINSAWSGNGTTPDTSSLEIYNGAIVIRVDNYKGSAVGWKHSIWRGSSLGQARQPSASELGLIYRPSPDTGSYPSEQRLIAWFPASISGLIYMPKRNDKVRRGDLLITDRPYPDDVVISGDWKAEIRAPASPRQGQSQVAPSSPGGPRSIRGTQPASADVPSVIKQIFDTFMRR